MEKQICLVTSEESFCNNFGAALQGYALYHTLNQYFGNCEILHYDSTVKTVQPDGKQSTGPITVGRLVSFVKRRIYYRRNGSKIAQRREKFSQFQNIMKFTDSNRYSEETIGNLKKHYDVLVCGSDQIWNPVYKGNYNDPVYFLQFSSPSCKRIAYAPSIGLCNFPQECKESFCKYLNRLDCLSVREVTGQQIIRQITGKEVPVLPDPTFLLQKQEWDDISTDCHIGEDYILLYRFVESDEIDRTVRKMAEKYHMKVITVPMYYNEKDKYYERKYDVGPAEFLGLIKNAKFVCTESFHATVFSIIFGVPFAAFARKDLKKEGDSRVRDLLSTVGLEDHIFSGTREVTDADFDISRILQAQQEMSRIREKGMEYLNEAFEQESQTE